MPYARLPSTQCSIFLCACLIPKKKMKINIDLSTWSNILALCHLDKGEIFIMNYIWFTNANTKDECNTIPLQIYKFYVNKKQQKYQQQQNDSTKLLSRFSFSLFLCWIFFLLFDTGFFFFFIVFNSSTFTIPEPIFLDRLFIYSCKIAYFKLSKKNIQHILLVMFHLSAHHWNWSMLIKRTVTRGYILKYGNTNRRKKKIKLQLTMFAKLQSK